MPQTISHNTSDEELKYMLALTLCPHVGPVTAKKLIQYLGSAEGVFKQNLKQLKSIQGLPEKVATHIIGFNDFKKIEDEISFTKKHKIQILQYNQKTYPQKLLDANDAPLVLYYMGNADLNSQKIISIVGTRKATEYGKQLVDELIKALKNYDCLVVSGLAYGIDAQAHKSCVAENVSNIGVLAHGLDRIYPKDHASLAKKMLQNGGLLSEYMSGTNPDRENFPTRNRIVAAMCNATIVIESAKKGGALITASLANTYNRDVFAYPGRTDQVSSQGCNWLIKHLRAGLIENPQDLFYELGWENKEGKFEEKQIQLPLNMNKNEQKIFNVLKTQNAMHIDHIVSETEMNMSDIALTLIELEMKDIIRSMPGKMYGLI